MPRTKRKELHSDDMGKIEQKRDIGDDNFHEPEIVEVDPALASKDYLDELKFNEEPVTIRIEPSTDKNAGNVFPVWNNGIPAEVFERGQWRRIGWLPVGRPLIVKRKTVATMIMAKIDTIETQILDPTEEKPNNVIRRFTSAVHSFSIMEDNNPKGAAWATELRRRNM